MSATPEFGDAGLETLHEILNAHRGMEGALLPILHAVQEAFGHVPQEALPVIAKDLNITRAEAHGVMSFYHDFRENPAGRTVLKLCRAEACQSVGADALADHARGKLGIDWHETTADGAVTLEPIFCLGLCACGPAAMVNGKLVGRADVAKLDRILEGAR
ncbi:formate dehydrogenase subunit gamma [Pararhodobacter aggregans]|uniref:Formate dehydrogenase subunit gamma n=1 Tax=Pararhodobacter aggregans TaxID=404875 RepID=A0A2T7UNP4_9RHOB|nr:formate dehydrogenase subunit gamma [Pararhodobacter aggregans]PTX00702.1 formate dehydrogenase gamma subunit [Pararhodobacter aggregans]PVE46241.1 formate dehydrogenase subunit gamma [Pararhodobacter aggregans]